MNELFIMFWTNDLKLVYKIELLLWYLDIIDVLSEWECVVQVVLSVQHAKVFVAQSL